MTYTRDQINRWSNHLETALPIPEFDSVKATFSDRDCTMIIVPARSGHTNVFNVILIARKEGITRCVGRELDLKLCRQIASDYFERRTI